MILFWNGKRIESNKIEEMGLANWKIKLYLQKYQFSLKLEYQCIVEDELSIKSDISKNNKVLKEERESLILKFPQYVLINDNDSFSTFSFSSKSQFPFNTIENAASYRLSSIINLLAIKFAKKFQSSKN